jgi:hypothetical protein
MKFIPRTVHAALDYIVGVLLILAPTLFGFSHIEAARNVALLVGGGTLLYSLLTAYEFGLIKLIPFSGHLALDVIGGFLLLASPWLFGFSNELIGPHVAFGLFEITAGLCTRWEPAPRPIVTSR